MRTQLASFGAGVAQGAGGAVRSFANGTITIHSDCTLGDSSIAHAGDPVVYWSAESGGTSTVSGAFTTDQYGRIPGWVDEAIYAGVQVDVRVPPSDPVTVHVPTPAVTPTVVTVLRNAPLNLMDPGLSSGPAANDGTTDASAALTAAHTALPAAGGRIFLPQGTGYSFNNVTITKKVELIGDGNGTLIVPGASGQALTFTGGPANLTNLCVASRPGGTTSPYAYSKPLVVFNGVEAPRCRGVTANLTQEGTLFQFKDSYDSEVFTASSALNSGPYGVGIQIDSTNGTNDTIGIRDVLCKGRFGVIMHNPQGALYAIDVRQWKQVGGTYPSPGSGALLEDSLASDAHAGDTVIHIKAAASWNQNDAVMIAGNFTMDSGGRTGNDVEVCRVSSVAVTNSPSAGNGTLTLTQALQYDHTTNAGSWTVQCLRGGMGFAIPSATGLVRFFQPHFEGIAWGGMAADNVSQLTLDGADVFCNRLLRIAGYVTHLRLGHLKTFGRSSEDVIIDNPSFAPNPPVRGSLDARTPNFTPSGGTGVSAIIQGVAVAAPKTTYLDFLNPAAAKAGAPTDADFLCTPQDGAAAADTTNHVLYHRNGGAWKANAPSTVSTGNIALPIVAGGIPQPAAPTAIGTAFKAFFMHTIIPTTGVLHAIAVWNGATVAGNIMVAVFDTGDTTAGSYTSLWSSASTAASGGASAWQSNFGDPALSVVAGQHVMLAVMNDGTTWTPGRFPNATNVGVQTMPSTSWLPANGGAIPKLVASFTYGSLAFSAVTEANMVTALGGVFIMGRIT